MLRARMQSAALSMAIVGLAYWAYAVCAVPWIEPPLEAAVAEDIPYEEQVEKPTDRYRSLLAPYFPADSWELNQAQVTKNSQFVLLLREFERLDGGRRLKLSPCTLIFRSEPTHDSKPTSGSDPAQSLEATRAANASQSHALILQAPEGAILEFDRPFDPKHGLGKLKSGILRGEVVIRSHGPLGDQGELRIKTQHVQLNEERIWTPYDVDIQWGDNQLRGRDMTVRLMTEEQSRLQLVKDEVASRIQSVELVQVDLLRLMMESSLFAGDKQSATPASDLSSAKEPIDLQCSGRMLIDMLGRIATLEGQVSVTHSRGNERPDMLRCDAATLHFLRRHKLAALTTSTADDKADVPDFEVVHVTALGSPAHLDLPSRDIEARGRRLEYHVRDRRVLLSDDQEAYARYGPHVVRSPRVDCRFADMSTLTVDAEGPGRYDRAAVQPKDVPLQVRWQGLLRVQPDADGHLASLSGGAMIEAVQWGYLSGDRLDMWLRRNADSSINNGATAAMPNATGWAPDRMRAEGNVAFDSPRLGGRTQLLQIWFDPATIQAPQELQLNQPNSITSSVVEASPGGTHFILEGDQINAQVAPEGKGIRLSKATVKGNVQVQETPSEGNQREPISMSGQTLQLENASLETGVAAIYGAPAAVRARGMEVSATEIHLDRAKNHIWINVPGTVAVPLPAKIAAEFSRPRATANLTWQGRMDFDGQTISCFRNIEIRTPAQLIQAQSLQAALTTPVDLSKPRIDGDNVQLGQMQLAGNVWMENNSFDDEGLASVERVLLRQVAIDNTTGQISGEGPGSVSSVRRGQSALPGQPASDEGMTYLQVDFRQGIDGNLRTRELSFVGNVQAIHGPVDAWNRILDVNSDISSNSRNVRMQCQRLTVSQMAAGQLKAAPLEFVASGDTLVEGAAFQARANRISFDQAKDLLIMEGDDRHPAQLWRQTQPGAPRTHGKARKIQYWPHSNRVSAENFSGDFLGLGQ